MINAMQRAVMRKDMRAIVFNRRLFPVLLIIPLVFTLVLPSIFILVFYFAPDNINGIDQMLSLLPGTVAEGDTVAALIGLVMDRVMPIFFIMIPVMVASVMAASAFVGEKEKRTLETLLYAPLSLRQLFVAKVLAAFVMSMLISIASFVLMLIVVGAEIKLMLGYWYVPNITWLITMVLLSPSISLVAITLIVRGSAKAQTVEESQQRAVFLILPLLVLIVGQFTGLLLISGWVLTALGVLLALLAVVLLRRALHGFTYEALLA